MLEKEQMILDHENKDIIEKWPEFIKVWPSKKECTKLAKSRGYNEIRFIGPRNAITMDYHFDRLNIYYDSNNKITKIDKG